jgi:8-oxo-dGTP diphosphatase
VSSSDARPVDGTTDWRSVPIFGVPESRFPARVRPSAYGIVVGDEGLVAIVRTPEGVYLPGGGSDDGETPDATVVREVREETGLVVQIGSWRQVAIEHVSSVSEQAQFEKRNTFCEARVVAVAGDAVDADHELIWLPATEAAERLTPLSHRWAVGEWRVRHT